MRRFVVVIAVACSSPSRPAPAPVASPPPTPAVVAPKPVVETPPALRLPRTFLPASYAVHLAIDPAKDAFDGRVEITGMLAARTNTIWLHGYHLTIVEATLNGEPVIVTPHGDDLLAVTWAAPFQPGLVKLAITYRGEIDPKNTAGVFKQAVGKDTYVYTQLEALFARRVFPCFDEPDVKVPWKLSFAVPKTLAVVANTPQSREWIDGDTKHVEFAVTKPLPTYLVAFGIGPFEFVDAGKSKSGTPIRIATLAGRRAEAAYAAKTSAPLLDAAEDYFGIPYPYEKLDMLVIPITEGFAAMENAGLITYTETLVLMDPKRPAKGRQAAWIDTAAHEIAHQWFGNLVTPAFWDDIWLNEGFADWVAIKLAMQVAPELKLGEQVGTARIGALWADSLVTARKIRQPIASTDDIYTAFDGISYQKGASVLQMFEQHVGIDVFQRGVREYLKSRAWGNATSSDFVAAIAKAANKPELAAAITTFLDQAGTPELAYTATCSGGKATVALTQRRYLPPGAPAAATTTPWHVPVCLAYERGGKAAESCTMLTAESATVTLESCPAWVMPNASGRGYYRVAYTPEQVTALRDKGWTHLTWPARRALNFDIKEAARIGKLPLALALSFTPKMLAGKDRYTIGAAVEQPLAFDAFVPDDLRGAYEAWLRAQFGALAKAAGYVSRPTDTFDLEETRSSLIRIVASLGRDPVLVGKAVALVPQWRTLPESVRGTVLAIAVDAKPALFTKILGEIPREPDRTLRGEMIGAVSSVRDPKQFELALRLMLDPAVDIRESAWIPFSGSTRVTQDLARTFMRDNLTAILARMPNAQAALPLARFALVFTAACRAEQRAEIVAYVTKHFEPMPGGKRVVQQAIEQMDQCIAKRAILEPAIRAWLRP